MADGNSVSRDHESYGSAHVVRRSRLFFTFPVVIIIIISVNFVWEIIQINLDPHTLALWPFRFTIINDSTTVTILAVFVSLFMGRLQWARSLRPTAGVAIDDDGARFKPDSDKWRVWIYNAGPGGAVIDSINYYVRFIDQSNGESPVNWVPLSIVNDQLRSRNLIDGADYFIRWYSRGAPFAVVPRYSEGMQLAWFTVKALTQIRILDVRVRYVDSLGDTHEKIIPIMHRLPSVTVTAVRVVLSKGSLNL